MTKTEQSANTTLYVFATIYFYSTSKGESINLRKYKMLKWYDEYGQNQSMVTKKQWPNLTILFCVWTLWWWC